jgi:glycosyltransferase 2 family protein
MTLRRLLLITKVVLSLGLLWYVAAKFDLQQGLTELRNISVTWLFAIFALYSVQLLVAALRFREFLHVMGAEMPLLRCLDATLIGYFFSQTFISFVGGDAMRVYRISQYAIPLVLTAKAVVLDRASGFAGQVLLIVLTLPFALPLIQDPVMRLSLLLLVAFALAVGAGVILVSRLPQGVRRLKALNAIADVSGRVLKRISTPKGAAAFFGYSLAINLLNILIFFAIANALNVGVGIFECLILLPPVFFISMLPISISGWGVREGAAILAFGLLGIPATEALAVSVTFGLGLILISLPGGAIWITTRRKRPTVREVSDAKNQV